MSSLHTGQLKYQVHEAKALLTGEKSAGRCSAYQCTHLSAFASHQPFQQQNMEFWRPFSLNPCTEMGHGDSTVSTILQAPGRNQGSRDCDTEAQLTALGEASALE